MSSFVFYRFKSQKEPSRISFDGTGISVWDLKKEIIMENKMGKGGDFDFAIYNEDTEEGAFSSCRNSGLFCEGNCSKLWQPQLPSELRSDPISPARRIQR